MVVTAKVRAEAFFDFHNTSLNQRKLPNWIDRFLRIGA
jgi:hypothetical protein